MRPDEPALGRRIAAEAVGSFFLFACVIGSGIMAEHLSGWNDAVALLGNTLATGAILFVLITMLGPISGAHMNPAVSLVAAARRELGWGVSTGTALDMGILGEAVKDDRLLLQVTYGEGISNYMNDGGTDLAPDSSPPGANGEAVPTLGWMVYYDRTWNDKWTSSFGYSLVDIDNSDGQEASAFKTGQYALGNLLYHPVPNFFAGGELQWGKRENFSDGWSADDVRIQFSAKYSFSYGLGGQ